MSFLGSLDNFLLKNVFLIKFQNGAHLKKKDYFWFTFHILKSYNYANLRNVSVTDVDGQLFHCIPSILSSKIAWIWDNIIFQGFISFLIEVYRLSSVWWCVRTFLNAIFSKTQFHILFNIRQYGIQLTIWKGMDQFLLPYRFFGTNI